MSRIVKVFFVLLLVWGYHAKNAQSQPYPCEFSPSSSGHYSYYYNPYWYPPWGGGPYPQVTTTYTFTSSLKWQLYSLLSGHLYKDYSWISFRIDNLPPDVDLTGAYIAYDHVPMNVDNGVGYFQALNPGDNPAAGEAAFSNLMHQAFSWDNWYNSTYNPYRMEADVGPANQILLNQALITSFQEAQAAGVSKWSVALGYYGQSSPWSKVNRLNNPRLVIPSLQDNCLPASCFQLDPAHPNDCNHNGIDDSCEIEYGYAEDCNGNGRLDSCDVLYGFAPDCNDNGIPDSCDIASGTSSDCNGNGIPDECDLASGVMSDCNGNGIGDVCDIASGFSEDCNGNGIPDECFTVIHPKMTGTYTPPDNPVGPDYQYGLDLDWYASNTVYKYSWAVYPVDSSLLHLGISFCRLEYIDNPDLSVTTYSELVTALLPAFIQAFNPFDDPSSGMAAAGPLFEQAFSVENFVYGTYNPNHQQFNTTPLGAEYLNDDLEESLVESIQSGSGIWSVGIGCYNVPPPFTPTVSDAMHAPVLVIPDAYCLPDDCYVPPLTSNPLQGDCNGNQVWDECEVPSGMADDTNKDGIPDECE